MAALAGRNPMFQLEGLNRKSRTPSAILERLLHQHMRRTGGEAKMAQMFLDSIRYGFAPTKITWDANRKTNVITNFDPRRAFPDPRVSWGDWERMAFISFVDYASTSSLLASGQYPKLSKYPALRKSMQSGQGTGWDAHNMFYKDEGRGHNIDPLDPSTTDSTSGTYFSLQKARVVDETWVRLNGYEIGVPSINQLWLVTTVLDERVVIRCQLNPYGRQFPVVIGGMYQDAHKTYSQSLYDLLLPMHDISTWMLRSRIDNVQLALQNLIFADPTQINIADQLRAALKSQAEKQAAELAEAVEANNMKDIELAKLRQGKVLQPLSDEQIAAEAMKIYGMRDWTSIDIRFARAIERLITERMSAGEKT